MTTDNFCIYLENRLIQTSQIGGQWYSDTSPFSIPWLNKRLTLLLATNWGMDKLKLTGQNLGPVFNSRCGCKCAMHLCRYEAKRPNLKLKSQPKQLLGSALPAPGFPN